MATNSSRSSAGKNVNSDQQNRGTRPEHDQDSDPPRTAVPPDSPTTPGQPTSNDPTRDQDSDPPRTPVFP